VDINIDHNMGVMKDNRIYCVPFILRPKSCYDHQDGQINNQ